MMSRSLFAALLLVLGSSAAFAEGESNRLSAAEVSAGTGVYYNAPSLPAQALEAPAARR